MAIVINGKDLQKRIINGQEVQKVIVDGVQIRPNGGGSIWEESIDFTTQRTLPGWETFEPYELSNNGLTPSQGYTECRFIKGVSIGGISKIIIDYTYRTSGGGNSAYVTFDLDADKVRGGTYTYNNYQEIYYFLLAGDSRVDSWDGQFVPHVNANYVMDLVNMNARITLSNVDTSALIGQRTFNLTQSDVNRMKENSSLSFKIYSDSGNSGDIYLENIEFIFK